MNRALITLMCLGLMFDGGSEQLLGDYIQEGRTVLRSTSKKAAAAFSNQDCYQCGYCCKEMPCIYGKWNEAAHQCSYLEVAVAFSEYSTYRCSQYETISSAEASKKYPMFGGGCGRPLLNPDRDRIKQIKS